MSFTQTCGPRLLKFKYCLLGIGSSLVKKLWNLDGVVDTAVCDERNQTNSCDVKRERRAGMWAKRPPTKNLHLTLKDNSETQSRHCEAGGRHLERKKKYLSLLV